MLEVVRVFLPNARAFLRSRPPAAPRSYAAHQPRPSRALAEQPTYSPAGLLANPGRTAPHAGWMMPRAREVQ